MSANNLLVNGLINPALVPASAIPANPVFQSVAIAPDAGVEGVLSVENPSGSAYQIVKELDGSVNIYQETAPNVYGSVFAVDSGATYVTVRAPEVKLGIESDATPNVEVLGSAGLGQVYDTRYNPINQPFNNPVGVFANWSVGLTTPVPPNAPVTVNQDFLPYRSGLYALVNTLGIQNEVGTTGHPTLAEQIDPNGMVEGYVSVGAGGSGNFVAGSGFIWNCSLGAQPSEFVNAIDPLEWTQVCLFYLTAGQTYNISIIAHKNATNSTGTFNLACFGQIIQMC